MILLFCTEILEDPKDITVFEGQKAVFICQIKGDGIFWKVNGNWRQLDDIMSDTAVLRGRRRLEIVARAEYNNSEVQCVATLSRSNIYLHSMNATLTIQGLLLP